MDFYVLEQIGMHHVMGFIVIQIAAAIWYVHPTYLKQAPF